MKNTWLITLVCLITVSARAQTIIEKHLSFSQKSSVALNIQIADSIKIIPWDKDEVYVWASVNVNDNKDNDSYKWTFDESGNEVNVKAKFADKEWPGNRNNNCCCVTTDIYCEVHIPANARVSVETINGNLILSGNSKDMHIKTISGFIDLSAPSNLKADMEFKTITGTVYTNFALNIGSSHHSGPTNFNTSLNGGGIPIDLETISGNIYFRRSE